jgi:hypothetical protein
MMAWLFGKRKTLQEQIEEQKEELTIAKRQLQREQTRLDRELNTTREELKRAAKDHKPVAFLKTRARLYRQKQMAQIRLERDCLRIEQVKEQISTVKTYEMMQRTMQRNLSIMQRLRQMLPAGGALMEFYEKYSVESGLLSTQQAVVDEQLDELQDSDELEEDEDDILAAVFDEVGIELEEVMPAAGTNKGKNKDTSSTAPVLEDPDDALMHRLAALSGNKTDKE